MLFVVGLLLLPIPGTANKLPTVNNDAPTPIRIAHTPDEMICFEKIECNKNDPAPQERPVIAPRSAPIAQPNPKAVPSNEVAVRGNCVATVRAAGYHVPRTKDGYARTIPVSSTALPPEGVPVVIKTTESAMGHVLVAVNHGGKLTSVVEGNHPVGAGRVVPNAVYRGYVANGGTK